MDLANFAREAYDGYRNFQANHSHLGSMLTSEIVWTTGDAVSQLITDKKIDRKKLRYTAALAPLYGLCLEGLLETGEIVGRHISENPLTKAALGPNIFGNFFNAFFFANNTIGEKKNYRLKELAKHYGEVFTPKKGFWKNFKEKYIANIPKKEFAFATLVTLTFWNGFQYANYAYVEKDMRVSTVLATAFVWTSLLSLWSLNGRREIAEKIGKK